MFSFRSLSLALTLFLGFSAVAQTSLDGSSVSSLPRAEPDSRRGLEVSYLYTNVSDASNQAHLPGSGRQISASTPEGMNGISLGYKQLQEETFGYDLAGHAMVGTNSSVTSSDLRMYQAVADINYSFTPKFYSFLGVNGTTISNSKGQNSVDPGVGGQAGLGLNIRGFQLIAGYNLSRYTVASSTVDAEGTTQQSRTTYAIGGFMGQAGYLF